MMPANVSRRPPGYQLGGRETKQARERRRGVPVTERVVQSSDVVRFAVTLPPA